MLIDIYCFDDWPHCAFVEGCQEIRAYKMQIEQRARC
jgi:hypothetical protein